MMNYNRILEDKIISRFKKINVSRSHRQGAALVKFDSMCPTLRIFF